MFDQCGHAQAESSGQQQNSTRTQQMHGGRRRGFVHMQQAKPTKNAQQRQVERIDLFYTGVPRSPVVLTAYHCDYRRVDNREL